MGSSSDSDPCETEITFGMNTVMPELHISYSCVASPPISKVQNDPSFICGQTVSESDFDLLAVMTLTLKRKRTAAKQGVGGNNVRIGCSLWVLHAEVRAQSGCTECNHDGIRQQARSWGACKNNNQESSHLKRSVVTLVIIAIPLKYNHCLVLVCFYVDEAFALDEVVGAKALLDGGSGREASVQTDRKASVMDGCGDATE